MCTEQGQEAEQTDLYPRKGAPEVLRVFLTVCKLGSSRLTRWTKRGAGYITAPIGRGVCRIRTDYRFWVESMRLCDDNLQQSPVRLHRSASTAPNQHSTVLRLLLYNSW